MIIPEVTLLKIDQMANKPIPITANTEENKTTKSRGWVPNIKGMMMRPIKINVTVTYLFIKWILAILMPFPLEILVINVVSINLVIIKKIRRIPVAMNAFL